MANRTDLHDVVLSYDQVDVTVTVLEDRERTSDPTPTEPGAAQRTAPVVIAASSAPV